MSSLDHRNARPSMNARSHAGARSNLALRTASALALAPVVIGVAYVGGWVFYGVCAIAGAGILWEWLRLVLGRSEVRTLLPGLAGLLAAMLLTGLDRPDAAIGAVAAGAVVTGLLAALPSRLMPGLSAPLWASSGAIYAGLALLGPGLLRRDSLLGFVAIAFLAATVWLTDIFAYVVGRTVGGALLWPRVSPNKTWAGACGGVIGGVVGGVAVAYASGLNKVGILGIIALLLSVLAQAGDLFESAVKRRFGAKDTSQIIPGHGGLMDRLDGLLVAALAALVLGILRQGTDAPAQGFLVW